MLPLGTSPKPQAFKPDASHFVARESAHLTQEFSEIMLSQYTPDRSASHERERLTVSAEVLVGLAHSVRNANEL